MGCCSRAGCKPGVPCRDLLPAGAVGRGSPPPSLSPQPGPAGVPGRPRPQCLTPASCSLPAGHQEALQPHPGGDLPLLLVPPPDQQPHLLHRRAGKGHPGLGKGSAVGGPWRQAGSASARACFWGAPPGTIRRALASLLLGGFSRGADPTVAVTAVCPWGGPRASRLPGGPWVGHGDGRRLLGRVPRRDCPHARCWGREGMGGGQGFPLLGPLLDLPPRPQVSHHPPVSAFHVSNRKDGFCISGSITAKSRFYGERGAAPWGLPGGLGETGWGGGLSPGFRAPTRAIFLSLPTSPSRDHTGVKCSEPGVCRGPQAAPPIPLSASGFTGVPGG